jgi:Flp pilus assembly protein TadB
MKSSGEWITVPIMNYILLTLLPLILVRKTGFLSLAAANGQFMFFQADVYNRFQPHDKLKSSKVEDIQIAHYFKKSKIKVACVTSKDSIQCRMYNGFDEAVNGFSKNITMFFGNSFFAAILFWLVTSFGFIIVLVKLPVMVLLIFLLILILTRAAVSLASGQNILKNIILLVPQQLTMGVFIMKAFENKLRKRFEWKGRSIS